MAHTATPIAASASSSGSNCAFSARSTPARVLELAHIARFWMLKVNSMEEAVEWVKRIPSDPERPDMEGEIDIRPIFDVEDFGAELTPELRKLEERLRTKAEKLKQS